MTCVKTYWPAYIGAPAIKTSRRGRKTPEKIQVDNESKRHFTENYQLVILSSTNNVGTPVALNFKQPSTKCLGRLAPLAGRGRNSRWRISGEGALREFGSWMEPLIPRKR